MTVDVTAVLVNYNTARLLPDCLSRLNAASESFNVQTLVVDNASRDDSLRVLRSLTGNRHVVENLVNVGFARANNQMMSCFRGRYILLLNTDALIESDSLIRTLAYMDDHPNCGVLGVRLVGLDGELQPSCRYFPTPWNVFLNRTGLSRWFHRSRMVDDWNWDHDSVRQCDWVPGCFYMIRKEVVETVGLFDPRYFLYYEEVDHCRRVKSAGWNVTYFPGTVVVHLGGESAKSEGVLGAGRQVPALQIESELLYFRKHHGLSGVCVALILAGVGDVILASKCLLRRGAVVGVASSFGHAAATFRAFVCTRAGSRATR